MNKMFLAPVVVEQVDVNTGYRSPVDARAVNEAQSTLATALRSKLPVRTGSLSQVTDLPDANTKTATDLGPIYRTIKRHSAPLDAAQQEQLSEFAAQTGASHLMFCSCDIYSGPGGRWDPMSGAIASGGSRIVLECNLYDIQTKKIVWTRASQARASAADLSSNLLVMAPLVLATLEIE
ncbi:hypothetical protein [uncultured Thiodictyon sp.]|uniref:hypothetical protein n=1 Tax=uncultured Thiodictyon sp. TaxID=1846217 RepID=UPI0025EC295C|nr:hypothetical protein [uncultured Thiodictyon sp.]